MKKLFMTSLALVAFQPLMYGMLPPLWKDVAELKAILNDSQLGSHLSSGDVIYEIKRFDNSWIITTNHGKVEVKVNYQKQEMPGKGEFNLEFITND